MNRRNKIDLYFILFSILILLLLIFPLFEIGNKVTPFVLGIPFSLFWIVSCIIFQFIGIVIFLLIDKDK
ncbi:MAG: hypothetical protein CFH34_00385 [Alphaproteobacteria bacterium MarineAlpha9_Bin4]|nr:MAG: hypothetical protein CFH34_00385 [Alphaproteobacteria bacterium MarineAlpha9_Bin4]